MSNEVITKIKAREVLDSRGNPTVEVEVSTSKGTSRAMVPSGASTGAHEACELRDGGTRYGGRGVLNAVRNVNEKLSNKLVGMSVGDLKTLDEEMIVLDATPNKAALGANAILGVSLACARNAALCQNTPLYSYISAVCGGKPAMPCPQFNVLNGGKHAGLEHDVQETMVLPTGAENFKEALQMGTETYHVLRGLLKKKIRSRSTLVGDEGGFVPNTGTEGKLELLTQAIEQSGYGDKLRIGLDAAASEFFEDGKYQIGEKTFSQGELVDYYSELSEKFKIVSIEDGMNEDDWDGWVVLTEKIGSRVQIVGDDLLTTNPARIKNAAEKKACNSLLLKVNQIGTLTESLDAARISKENNWSVVVSHRSGETEDAFISDLSVGIASSQIKTGAPARSDRVAKYNQLLRIEEELLETGHRPEYGGRILG
ncbi:MAG: phosphopyruvate hydratase [Candidatus Micrarchaeia archaeon]